MRDDEKALLVAVLGRPGERPSDLGAGLGMHHKRVAYLCRKWARHGDYDYGTSPDFGRLTPVGKLRARGLLLTTDTTNQERS